jgi:hypothetical protein
VADRRLLRAQAKKEFKKLNKNNKIPKSKRLPFSSVYKVLTSSLSTDDAFGTNKAESTAAEITDDLSDMIDGG